MPNAGNIKTLRPQKNAVDPLVPYHFLHETEVGPQGLPEQVNTLFLTNKECPFTCLMCDLWKNTLDGATPAGAVLAQVDHALARLPKATTIKLYNSGNFFDQRAIPPEDYLALAKRLQGYKRVIVENHPKLCGQACLDFNAMIEGKLEIALGLESIHPQVLPKLNKQMSLEDYQRASEFLTQNGIGIRTFILLNPPYLTDQQENVEWTLKAVDFAFEHGSQCCAIIPTRTGNGVMEQLEAQGHYVAPTLTALETVFVRALALQKGRVLVDLWDLERFSDCPNCFAQREARLHRMNLNQKILPPVSCTCP